MSPDRKAQDLLNTFRDSCTGGNIRDAISFREVTSS
jgi:hypothetical protein